MRSDKSRRLHCCHLCLVFWTDIVTIHYVTPLRSMILSVLHIKHRHYSYFSHFSPMFVFINIEIILLRLIYLSFRHRRTGTNCRYAKRIERPFKIKLKALLLFCLSAHKYIYSVMAVRDIAREINDSIFSER